MDEVLSKSSPNTNEDSPELSFSVLNACSEEQKSNFRLCERTLLKTTCISSHLSFDETCVNMYIYIYALQSHHTTCPLILVVAFI